MSESKRFYWLKLKEDFFEDDTISFIEEQPNGIEYSNFYLKLCLKSLKNNGKLIRIVGNTLIPYDIPALAKLTGVPVDTVRCAMALFEKFGLVATLDSGELFLQQISELVGSETNKAEAMRKSRARKLGEGNNVTPKLPEVTPVLPERDPELDIDKDIDKDIKRSEVELEGSGGKGTQADTFLTLGPNKNVLLTPYNYDFLKNNYSFVDEAISRLSNEIQKNGDNHQPHFTRLLEWLTAKAMSVSQRQAPPAKTAEQSFEDKRQAAIASLSGK